MRISDGSSDVCSSDLQRVPGSVSSPYYMVLPESPAISSAPLPWGARTAGRHCASPDDGNRTPPRCSAAGSPKNPGNLNGFIPVPNDQAQGLPTPAGSHAENPPDRKSVV